MHKGFLKAGALFGILAVLLGAFGAHSIKDKVTPDALGIFETGVRYQFYHAFALILTGILYKEFTSKRIIFAGRMFIAGIILFSGSLYLLTYLKTAGAGNLSWAGIITPFGGGAFIAGWIFLLSAFSGKKCEQILIT